MLFLLFVDLFCLDLVMFLFFNLIFNKGMNK